MLNENPLTLHQADQARTDFAAIESDLNAIMDQIARLPTYKELAKMALLIAFVSAVLGIVGIELSGATFRHVARSDRRGGSGTRQPSKPGVLTALRYWYI